jgi:alpha-ketoglutarate-dependent taurine dioxygenase
MTRDTNVTSCLLVIEPPLTETVLVDWAREHMREINELLLAHRALLFRGFRPGGGLDTISTGFFEARLAYTYRSTPRTNLGQYVFTATEYPRKQSILQHCENAYQRVWPMKLLFHCVQPATTGGRTPLANTSRVTRAIDTAVREEFERRGVRYVRNYRAGVDLPWEEVFCTTDRAAVERFCAEHGMECCWTDGGLRTSQVCQGFANHPRTGERLWFNQAHLFHLSSLEPAVRKMMLATFGEEGLPRQSYFGDGGAIPEDMLAHIRGVYERERIEFDWQVDDVLLIDNMLVSHGRDPYDGPRRVVVCMAEPYSPEGLLPSPNEVTKEIVKLHV